MGVHGAGWRGDPRLSQKAAVSHPTVVSTHWTGIMHGEKTMQKVNLTDKKCATCRWWQGERNIQFWNKKPFKVECDAKGDCMSIKASKPYSSSCPRWVAWEKLP